MKLRAVPFSIGKGQTISQSYIVALMTQILDVKPGEKVLEIGTGSGYQAAVLNHILPNPYQDHQDSIFSRKILNLETGIRLKITKPYQNIFVGGLN